MVATVAANTVSILPAGWGVFTGRKLFEPLEAGYVVVFQLKLKFGFGRLFRGTRAES